MGASSVARPAKTARVTEQGEVVAEKVAGGSAGRGEVSETTRQCRENRIEIDKQPWLTRVLHVSQIADMW